MRQSSKEKLYRGFRRYPKHVSRYNFVEYNGTKGVEFLREFWADSETDAVNDLYCEYDNDKYFPQDDETVTDHNGNLRYTPGDKVVSMGDYDYYVEEC